MTPQPDSRLRAPAGKRDGSAVDIEAVRTFWEEHPVASAAVPHSLESDEYLAYYDALRERFETSAFSAWLHEYARFAGKRVLDIGCGNGYVLSRYAASGARVCGVDLTNAAVRLCRRRFALAGLAGQFVVGNAEELPLPDHSFDCVCSMGVLHHTPNTAAAVAELYRVLRPGGRLIVMFYHRNSFQYRVKFPPAARAGRQIDAAVGERRRWRPQSQGRRLHARRAAGSAPPVRPGGDAGRCLSVA